MIILGIADSHESHACVLKDGELVAFMAEERLSRLKSDMGYPKLAINKVLEISGVDPSEIDIVVFAGHLINVAQGLAKVGGFYYQGLGNRTACFLEAETFLKMQN